jgi:tetratricopeptide (TPR) repeat protein
MFDIVFKKLGKSYKITEEFLKAGKIFDAYDSVKNRDEKEAQFLSGIFLIIMKKNKKGIEIILPLIKTGEEILGKEIMYEILGTAYYTEGNYLESAKYFMESLKINRDNFNSLFNLTAIYLVKKDYEKAYENLEKMIKLRPSDEEVRKNYKLVKERLKIK